MPVDDEQAALQVIAALEHLSPEQQEALNAINKILCNDEPFVDIHELFGYYNILYFRKLLLPRVEVLWSPRLTLCAGICELSKDPTTGKYTRIRLKLSTPLLQYRPRSDTINTLLHESIHAYFFITTSWRHSRGDDGTGHGTGFRLLSDAVNNHGNYAVTIYHTFHDEVDSYRTHVWQCDGPCRAQPPYFGLVKRSMNRPPGKSDSWWRRHEAECGGTYTKIQEPAPTKKQIEAMGKKGRAGRQKNKLDSWITSRRKEDAPAAPGRSGSPIDLDDEDKTSTKRLAEKSETGTIVDPGVLGKSSALSSLKGAQKRARAELEEDEFSIVEKKTLVECPICSQSIPEPRINEHLDKVHQF